MSLSGDTSSSTQHFMRMNFRLSNKACGGAPACRRSGEERASESDRAEAAPCKLPLPEIAGDFRQKATNILFLLTGPGRPIRRNCLFVRVDKKVFDGLRSKSNFEYSGRDYPCSNT